MDDDHDDDDNDNDNDAVVNYTPLGDRKKRAVSDRKKKAVGVDNPDKSRQ
jgi:hypothetical protein